MVNKEMSLKDLQNAVARERSKAKTAEEKAKLQRELKDFRAGKSTKLLKRLGRGFVILGKEGAKATGRGIVKVSKFAEESGAARGFGDVRLSGSLPSGRQNRPRRVPRRKVTTVTVVTRKRRKPSSAVIVRRTKTVTRRARRKPKKRTVRGLAQNEGFFGDISGLGI